MKITLEKITDKNEVLSLSVSEEQKRFIATNARSLEQAAETPFAEAFVIRADGAAVGFALLVFEDEYEDDLDRYWLWRFMIDERYQRRGYGRAALCEIIRLFESRGAKNVRLSTKPDNTRALSLYRSAGFLENGQKNGEETVLEKRIKK